MDAQALTRERRLLAMPRMIAISSRVLRAIARLFADPVVGNPLHEAWTADGEPIERLSPATCARSRQSRFAVTINGHSR